MHLNVPGGLSPFLLCAALGLILVTCGLGAALFHRAERRRSYPLVALAVVLIVAPIAGGLVGSNVYFTARANAWSSATASLVSQAREVYGVHLSTHQAGLLLSAKRVSVGNGVLKLKHTGTTYALTGVSKPR